MSPDEGGGGSPSSLIVSLWLLWKRAGGVLLCRRGRGEGEKGRGFRRRSPSFLEHHGGLQERPGFWEKKWRHTGVSTETKHTLNRRFYNQLIVLVSASYMISSVNLWCIISWVWTVDWAKEQIWRHHFSSVSVCWMVFYRLLFFTLRDTLLDLRLKKSGLFRWLVPLNGDKTVGSGRRYALYKVPF